MIHRFFVTIILFISSLSILGQGRLSWTENKRAIYPHEIYLTGFAQKQLQKNETSLNDGDWENLKTKAIGNLLMKISVNAENTTITTTESTIVNNIEQLRKGLSEKTIVSSKLDNLMGIKDDVHIDTDENIAYAFVFIPRQELINKYASNISLNLLQAEMPLQQWESSKQKVEIIKKCREIIPPVLAQVLHDQRLIIAVSTNSVNADENKLQTQRAISILEKYNELLKQTISVYVTCEEDILGSPSTIISNRVKKELTDVGCDFVSINQEADFSLTITAISRKAGNYGNRQIFYVDIIVKLIDNKTGKEVFADEFSEKDGSSNPEQAIRRIYERVGAEIKEKLIPHVKIKN
ncbi:MAG: hypothetical protein FWC39_10490 [Bacteroidetes bacterium]|nr:hypothetical protein [Bacteroidota bacterium]